MRIVLTLLILCIGLISCNHKRIAPVLRCACDTTQLLAARQSFRTDPITSPDQFYALSKDANRRRWFSEIENMDSTHDTRRWDSYHTNNFYASSDEFKKHYTRRPKVEMAIQIGPAGPLWSYYTFVLKREGCCYVFTRTTFTHARFRYKAYSVVSPNQVDSLFTYLDSLNKKDDQVNESEYTMATFIVHDGNEVFDVPAGSEMERVPPGPIMTRFITFLDAGITWRETYPMEVESPQPKQAEDMKISGAYRMGKSPQPFQCTVEIRKRNEYMWYSWKVIIENQLIAAKTMIVEFSDIPVGQNEFEYVRIHALEEIRNYKINEQKAFSDVSVKI